MKSSLSLRAVIVGSLVVAVLIAQLLAIHARGPWYDEFYTYYVVRPGPAFADLWAGWIRDNHPPLFYFLAWLGRGFGSTMEQRRLLNLALMLGAIAALVLLARRNAAFRRLAVPYAIALAGVLPLIERAAEYRSYFLSTLAAAVLIPALCVLVRPNERKAGKSAAAQAFLIGALMLAWSIHVATTIILVTITLAFGVRLLVQRDWRGAGALIAGSLIAGLPFATTMVLQFATMAHNTQTFWIPPGFNAARWDIENEVVGNLGANWLLTVLAAMGFVVIARDCWRHRRLTEQAALAATLMAGLGLAVVVLLAIHVQRPFVINRYLVSFHPCLAMIAAIGVTGLTERIRPRWRLLAELGMAIGALLAIWHNYEKTILRPTWDGTARAIAGMVAACPTTLVHADLSWNAPTMAMLPVDNRAVIPFAYRQTALWYHFALEPQGSHRMAATCPTLFWTEHGAGLNPTPQTVVQGLQRQGFAVTAGQLRRIGEGWIFVVAPRVPIG